MDPDDEFSERRRVTSSPPLKEGSSFPIRKGNLLGGGVSEVKPRERSILRAPSNRLHINKRYYFKIASHSPISPQVAFRAQWVGLGSFPGAFSDDRAQIPIFFPLSENRSHAVRLLGIRPCFFLHLCKSGTPRPQEFSPWFFPIGPLAAPWRKLISGTVGPLFPSVCLFPPSLTFGDLRPYPFLTW